MPPARAQAIAEGERTYMGAPCPQGHDGLRYATQYGGSCVHCRRIKERAKKRTPQQERKRDLRRNYAMTVELYDALLKAQGGTCAICDEVCPSGKRLAVDHDHVTDDIRGLLCMECNTGLGKFRDSPIALRYAADYVDAHRATKARVR
jgi:hypothetical protein